MNERIIEKLERLRYNLLKWVTIGWALWFGSVVMKNLVGGRLLPNLATWIGLFGWLIFIINLVQFFKLKRELKRDKKAELALNDEYHQFNTHKSFTIGFWVLLTCVAVFYGLSLYTSIKAVVATGVCLYAGVLATLISGLILNRDNG